MSLFLSLLLIFAFTIALFLVFIKVISLIFKARVKFIASDKKKSFTIFSLLALFISGLLINLLISNLFWSKLPQSSSLSGNFRAGINGDSISPEDCKQIIDTIYQTENQIYRVENHRYLEGIIPVSNIKEEYKKGAAKLQSAADEYSRMKSAEAGKYYINQIIEKIEEKAQLFRARTEIGNNNERFKEVVDLLSKMDQVTSDRQSIISNIEKKCNF